ncbi:P-II family nitrogen regulator [Sporomusa termitida]|uniref:Nitrogen regulatory protein P-II n=1 Tax=Sporomusa termitida TaxID=2377 RepID=A0A517DVR4_9FIRM|nr:hypothetical protein [Sporomusa termitida]QDR81413.1 hypothetical protein SPTER_27930 [Sporomusa termitida]
MQLEKHSHLAISLLWVICDSNRREKVTNILKQYETFCSLVTHGKGTANSKILNYLGLGESEKVVFFSILPTNTAWEIMDKIDEKLEMKKPGNGILFITQVHQGCYRKPVEFVSNANGGVTMGQDSAHNLIIVVLNRGYSEDVMDVARAYGAKGGTVLHARSCGMAEMEKFFGVTIVPEKEMLMIVAPNSAANAIMTGIAEKVGPTTDACGISFSLQVNGVKGIQTAKLE